MAKLTIQEFEAKATSRLLLDKLARGSRVRQEWADNELATSAMYVVNGLLSEQGLVTVRTRRRGDRIFIIHQKLHRIVCEVGIIGYRSKAGFISRPQIVLTNTRGLFPQHSTLEGLVERLEQRSERRKEYHGKN